MSIRLLLGEALKAGVPDHAVVGDKRKLHDPEAKLRYAESEAAKELLRASNYKATAHDTAIWDPVALSKRNPTNDPAHAHTFMWANQPPVMEQARRKVGLVKDEDAALRRVETQGHVQNYFNPAGAPPLPTLPPTPGYIELPGLR
jgi:hypothetical protein